MILEKLDFDSNIKDNNSFKKLKEIGLPKKKSENYRHINLQDLLQSNITLADNNNDDFYKQFINDSFYYLVIVNAVIDEQLSNLPKNISLSLKTKNNTNKENKALYLLSESFSEEECVLSISEKIDKPLMIINTFSGQNNFFANNLNISVSSEIDIDILEIFASKKDTKAYASINRVFNVKDANLNYTKLNIASKRDTININNKVSINGGNINIHTVEKGSKQSINEYDVDIEKENSKINMYSIIHTDGEQNINNTIQINHNNPNTHSNQIFKHILKDKAKAVFNSKIIINKRCSNSSAHQNSQTMLLSNDARIFNEPRMMIFTDELEASHGATVGSLNEDSINFMKLRGLNQEECEKILIQAFEDEIDEYIQNPLIQEIAKTIY